MNNIYLDKLCEKLEFLRARKRRKHYHKDIDMKQLFVKTRDVKSDEDILEVINRLERENAFCAWRKFDEAIDDIRQSKKMKIEQNQENKECEGCNEGEKVVLYALERSHSRASASEQQNFFLSCSNKGIFHLRFFLMKFF